ncbi:pseudouridine synthase [Mongoliitalea daihaiensis]|uniref:pseudouridine synthase n=1 Tax=Mongoliitalea daihaiensis TaxID=2782006 RepID=UPI001F3ABBC6|nr:pseudouridine synthase [Mongoliitalea daihaiensis]UJP64357.1 pseudouridylate synthase [Mongoliitalea daihaiensis]
MIKLEIIFEDDFFIAINKPAGVLVHKTHLADAEEDLIAVKILQSQTGVKVFPIHRIDRPTTGVLLFAKSSEAASKMQPILRSTDVQKHYLCVVRGHFKEKTGIIDQALKKKIYGELQEAQTSYWVLEESSIPYDTTGRYPSSRYALLLCHPHTGRMHQIRRHLAHRRHYIIGDTTHGDNTQNNFFRKEWGLHNLLLHAWQLSFLHPFTGQQITIQAELSEVFINMLLKVNFSWKPEKFDAKSLPVIP